MKIHPLKRYKFKNGSLVLDLINPRRIILLLLLILTTFGYFAIQNNFWLPQEEIQVEQKKESVQFAAYKQYIMSFNKKIDSDEAASIVRAVAKYSNRYKVDADVAFGLIEVESGFKKYAVSYADALGYTQVLPSQHLKEIKQFEDKYGHANLFDTEFNIALGLHILHGYVKQYKSFEKGALAYNGSLHFKKKDQVYHTQVLNAAKRIEQYRIEYMTKLNQQKGNTYATL